MTDICCVNVGDKYPKEYTERLFNMVKRHSTGSFKFYVITDTPEIYAGSEIIPVQNPADQRSWWSKMEMFKPGLLPDGEYLYFDLDVVITSNIDRFFRHRGFGIIRDFIRPTDGLLGGNEYNSSCMKFNNTTTKGLYAYYDQNREHWHTMAQRMGIPFLGDQNLVSAYLNFYPEFVNPFPDEWLWSFRKGAGRGDTAGDRSQWFGRKVPINGSVCVFHGNPNPQEILDNPDRYLKMGKKFFTQETLDWIKEYYK